MRTSILTTLAIGLLAVSANPAWAGSIKLTNRSDAGPVQVTFDEVNDTVDPNAAFGTINDVSFDTLYSDRETTGTDEAVTYNGFGGSLMVALNYR